MRHDAGQDGSPGGWARIACQSGLPRPLAASHSGTPRPDPGGRRGFLARTQDCVREPGAARGRGGGGRGEDESCMSPAVCVQLHLSRDALLSNSAASSAWMPPKPSRAGACRPAADHWQTASIFNIAAIPWPHRAERETSMPPDGPLGYWTVLQKVLVHCTVLVLLDTRLPGLPGARPARVHH